MPAVSSHSASAMARTLGQVAVIEVGDELADHQQHEDQAGEPGEGLRHRRDDVVAARERPGPDAVADPGDQERHRDDEQQAVHERRRPDDVAGQRVAERRAGREGQEQDEPDEAREGDERVAQAAPLGRRIVHGVGLVLDGDAIRPARRRRLERAQPRLDHALGDERGDDREQDRRHDAEPVVGEDRERRDAGGTERLVGDLGDLGVDRAGDRVDAEDRADAREARRHPGQRVASDAHERRRPERHEDQVAGVGRDARQDARRRSARTRAGGAARPRRAAG